LRRALLAFSGRCGNVGIKIIEDDRVCGIEKKIREIGAWADLKLGVSEGWEINVTKV